MPLYANSSCPLPPKRAENVTVSTFSLIASYAEHTFWRQMNGCKPVTLEEMAATEESQDPCTRAIGAPLDVTWTEEAYGTRLLMGSVLDETGRTVIQYIALEGAPHHAFPIAAKYACRFFLDSTGLGGNGEKND